MILLLSPVKANLSSQRRAHTVVDLGGGVNEEALKGDILKGDI